MIDNVDELRELPRGWAWVKISDIADLVRGVSYKKGEASGEPRDGYVPVLRANNIDQVLNFDSLVYVPANRVKNNQRIKTYDIVLAMSSGSKNLVGKAAQAVQDFDGGFGAFCGLVRLTPLVEREFVGYFFQGPDYRHYLSSVSSGVNINNLRRDHVESMLAPLPPLPEQQRIVAKIEELFTQLDAGVAALQQAKAQLQRYRQSVLKHAFEGHLTAAWREAHRNELEPASALLDRIRAEREQQEGKKVKLPPPLDTSELPELPEGWAWTRLGECAVHITKGESPGWQGFEYTDDGVPFIRSESVLWGNVDLESVVRIPSEFHEKLSRSQLRPLDVLFNLVGASIGRCGIVPATVSEANINQAVALIRLNEVLSPQYFMHLLLSPSIQASIQGSKVETARPNVSLTDLRELVIPICGIDEQKRIVDEMDRRLSVVDSVQQAVDQGLQQAERLRQSILKRAFEGKLVPQDPNDEPAEVLLECIRAAREGGPEQLKLPEQASKASSTISG